MAEFEWLDGGVTAVPGFLAAGIAAGIKPSGKRDLSLVHSPTPARVAAVFTANQVKGRAGHRLRGARARGRGPGHPGFQWLCQRVHR